MNNEDVVIKDTKMTKILLSSLLAICIGLCGVAYRSLDLRVTTLETQHSDDMRQHMEIAAALATLTANQIVVMQTLKENGVKLDRIQVQVYKIK
uniref:Uncharacterized protein n=1 Tax=viral metagenome TaxID=1070528 RepID=A0A6M3LF26_9ZZZZ